MKSYIETAALITGCGSAAFWFASAMCRLCGVKPGKDELGRGLINSSGWTTYESPL